MASAAQRQLDADIIKTIVAAGAKVVGKRVDGAGHMVVSFEHNGWPKDYHYAHSTQANGCARLNTVTRLRRIIREMPSEPPPRPQVAAPPVPGRPEPKHDAAIYMPAPATPPKSDRLTKARRKEIAKRYLSLPSLDALLTEFSITRAVAETLLLSAKGQAADKLKREKQAARMTAARVLREVTKTPEPVVPAPIPVLSRRERDRRIKRLYMTSCTTLKEIGARYGVSASTAWRIAHR